MCMVSVEQPGNAAAAGVSGTRLCNKQEVVEA